MSEIVIVATGADVLRGLKRLLLNPAIPGINWRVVSHGDRSAHLEVFVDGRVNRWDVKARIGVVRRDLDQIQNPEATVLVVTKLADGLVKQCAERGLSAIGLNGRVWLRAPGVLVDTKLPQGDIIYRTAEPEVDPFSQRSSRIARALLSSGERAWTVTTLAKEVGLSISRVSEVLNALKDHGWVNGSRGDWRLAEPEALLDAWVKDDDWSGRGTLKEYASLHPSSEALAQELLKKTSDRMAFTQWLAANLRFPYTTTPVCSVYRTQHLTAQEADAAGLREVVTGGRLWVVVPRDEGVFQGGRKVDGFPLVSDVQIYLDLLQVGLRGPDHAKALREWSGFRK